MTFVDVGHSFCADEIEGQVPTGDAGEFGERGFGDFEELAPVDGFGALEIDEGHFASGRG